MKTLTIDTSSCKSNIFCGSGAFEERAARLKGKKLFIVTDSNVYKLYYGCIEQKFGENPVYVLPAGEKSKNYRWLFNILSAMLKADITRADTVVAFGGGVVGDIAGLAASLYMRGINLIQIPTTLLAQVDSSVGGKTAVDFDGVKNVIGTFYQPSEVIVDPFFLSTLPKRQLRCGLGEIVKYGVLNADIFHELESHRSSLFSFVFEDGIVYDCIAHKAAVVAADERDTGGQRKTLNAGHTTGHAFELCYGHKSHGEFVLIGLFYETYIAVKLGYCESAYAQKLTALIKKVLGGIPYFADAGSAARLAKHDKKNVLATQVSVIAPQSEGKSVEIILSLNEYCRLIDECNDLIAEGKI